MNFTTLGLFAGIFFILGILAALAVVSLRSERKKPEAEEKPQPDQPAVPAEEAVTGQTPKRKEVARLWQDESSGKLLVELDGKVHDSATGLSVQQRERLSQAAKTIQSWLNEGQPASPPAPPQREGERFDLLSDRVTPPGRPPIFQEQPPPPRPRPSMVETFLRGVQTGTLKPKSEPKSIVAQIDEILQASLAGTQLEGRGVHLQERPDHSLEVVVGLERYAGIDAVPDEEVRSLIRRAVSEWERRTSPK